MLPFCYWYLFLLVIPIQKLVPIQTINILCFSERVVRIRSCSFELYFYDFNAHASIDQQPVPKQPTQRKARSLQQILDEFSPLTDIIYEPVKIEDYREVYPLLLPTFTEHSYLYDYFALFFTSNLFHLITKNTNQYIAIYRTVD